MKGLMYEMTGDRYTTARTPIKMSINNSRGRVVQICPPNSPHIKKSFEGILMYELAGGFINNCFNYADPNSRDRVVQLCPPARPYIKKSFEGILTLSYITVATWSRNLMRA